MIAQLDLAHVILIYETLNVTILLCPSYMGRRNWTFRVDT